MKQIQPIQIWKDGKLITANYLDLSIVHDNLQDIAVFLYRLCRYTVQGEDQSLETVIEGNQAISGQEYQNWGTTEDANEEAYTIITNKLNIQLI